MVDPLDKPDWLLDILTKPSVKDPALLFPEGTYIHTIPFDDLWAAEQEVVRALTLGGHRKADRIEPHPVAVDVPIDYLHDIAVEYGIDSYEVEHAMNANADLEITMVFAHLRDAVLFKLLLG